MKIPASARRRAAIPLTSLVDVTFILLFFFMIAASRTPASLPVALASATTTPAAATQTLDLLPGGRLQLDGETIELTMLLDRLRTAPGAALAVRPAHGTSLQELVGLLDALHGSGARVALAGAPQ